MIINISSRGRLAPFDFLTRTDASSKVVMRTFVPSILFGLVGVAWGQSETIKTIDAEVSRIDTNDKLTLKGFDAGDAYDQAFDRGGTIKVYLSNNEILKIEEEIGGSMAWSQTTLYFQNWNCSFGNTFIFSIGTRASAKLFLKATGSQRKAPIPFMITFLQLKWRRS